MISVDVNEGNVTVKVLNMVYLLQTDIKRLTLGYSGYREVMQSIKGNRHVKRVIHSRERNRKRDRRYKIANVIANTAKQLNAVVVLENLPKRCPKNMISNVNDKKLRHRIYQAGFRSLIKVIEEKCLERGVSVVKVDPRGTSSTCPFCNSKLMRGDAPRQLKCPKCNVEMGRDVVAVFNLEKRGLTLKGHVPFVPMPDESTPEVAVLPMKVWMRRKFLPSHFI
ncbi:IS200/IS605 family accessory protein TnpB-related protein [Archaeoglobus profundus]|uniref:IS200/IS605 family accessory protein TnpB-related protein n=1 Tax=Archaeoglobus profundus TaxID=84156 RepID=UPI000B1670C8|nr:zinc ribbon domain-containing protein [Archaeoglobus profundus]